MLTNGLYVEAESGPSQLPCELLHSELLLGYHDDAGACVAEPVAVYPAPGPGIDGVPAKADGLVSPPVAVRVAPEDDLKGLAFQNARLSIEQLGSRQPVSQLHPASPMMVNRTNAHRATETRMA